MQDADQAKTVPAPRRETPWMAAFDGLLLLAIVITVCAWVMDPFQLRIGAAKLIVSSGPKPFVVLLVLFASRVLVSLRFLLRTPRRVAWLPLVNWSMLTTLGFFCVFDGILELCNYSHFVPVFVTHDGTQRSSNTNRNMLVDMELIWKLNPGAIFRGRTVNAMGHLDREVDPVKKSGAIRVICLGDSVTGQGPPPYSGYLHERLQAEPPTPGTWEAFNMGVHGYSSSQGLRLFQRRTKPLEPDYVTIYFGWNDHWRSGRGPDHRRQRTRVGPRIGKILNRLREKRFYQLLTDLGRPDPDQQRDADNYVLRVSPDRYRSNLEQLVKESRSIGAVPILITAPRAEKLTKHLVKNKNVASLADAYRLHAEYIEICRDVALQTEAPLLDLAMILEPPDHEDLFSDDGIHLRAEGLRRIADEIHEKLIELTKGESVSP